MTNTEFEKLPVWQKNHLNTCLEKNLFKDKRVLEVGGQIPYEVTKSLGVKSWYCVDPAFEKNIDMNKEYKLYKDSILNFDIGEKFDLIIATNSFEHILGLDKGLEQMYYLLENGGYLSSLFGPIWSCYKGHHVCYEDKDIGLISFNNIKLDDWAHLLYSKEEVKDNLLKNYSEKTASDISYGIVNRPSLNKLFYDDYKLMIEKSQFKILEFRDWHTSKYPNQEIQRILEDKYSGTNFSTVSIKILLQK